MRRDGALLTLDDRCRLDFVGDGRILVAEISVKLGSITLKTKRLPLRLLLETTSLPLVKIGLPLEQKEGKKIQ